VIHVLAAWNSLPRQVSNGSRRWAHGAEKRANESFDPSGKCFGRLLRLRYAGHFLTGGPYGHLALKHAADRSLRTLRGRTASRLRAAVSHTFDWGSSPMLRGFAVLHRRHQGPKKNRRRPAGSQSLPSDVEGDRLESLRFRGRGDAAVCVPDDERRHYRALDQTFGDRLIFRQPPIHNPTEGEDGIWIWS
jgi:hypothetical protein